MSLKVQKGQTFGLLGPNGAGKTSLISILTGLNKPDNGQAWIAGYNITTQLDQAHLNIGVCPQFDILWPQLTVLEHLLFYTRIKGTPRKQESIVVQKAIKSVCLQSFENLKANQLSGGMKRRLSVAIALVGNPKIIFLDQPTTGLDPENRRQLWEILHRSREDRAVILTTHSMEEADILCSKIGIVNKGIMRCYGTPAQLKKTYGRGYRLYVNLKKGCIERDFDQVKRFVEKIVPEAVIVNEFNGYFVYQVQKDKCVISELFRKFQEGKQEVEICNWGISPSSLEDVFLKVIEINQKFNEMLVEYSYD